MTKIEHYVCADIDDNHNKYWIIELHDDYTVVTKWGRVGDNAQTKRFTHTSSFSAQKFFDKKVAEKVRKGYMKVDIVDSGQTVVSHNIGVQSAVSQIKTDAKSLIDYLAQVNIHNITSQTTITYNIQTGSFRTPLGLVGMPMLTEARQVLADMVNYVNSTDWDNPAFKKLAQRYLTLIPTNIGKTKPDLRRLYPNASALQNQNDIIDSLEAALGTTSEQTTQEVEKVFDVEISDKSLTKISDLDKIYRETKQDIHTSSSLKVSKVYEIKHNPSIRNFEQHKNSENIWELWHGTNAGNILSILKSGFIIPSRNSGFINGRAFGDGVYFSDQSTKSLNYSHGYWSGKYSDKCFMFRVQVAMGKYYTPKSSAESLPKTGYHSTFAERGKTSGLINNEMIVYDASRTNPIYLVEFSK